MKGFEVTDVVTNIERLVHYRFAHSVENINIGSESVDEDLNVSIPCRFQEIGVFYGTLWRILHIDLHLYPHK